MSKIDIKNIDKVIEKEERKEIKNEALIKSLKDKKKALSNDKEVLK